MIPFRVFDRDNKTMWIVLNYHADAPNGGSYLLAREDDSEADGELKIVQAAKMTSYRLIDFLDEAED
jgi:hypothetical protein